MAREFNDYEKEVYGMETDVVAPPIDDVVIPTVDDVVTPPVDDQVVTPPVDDVVAPQPVTDTPAPYKSKKFIEVENEEELYSQLAKKYSHKSLKPEEKALAYIRSQNPEYSEDDVAFEAASKYGIGVDSPDDDDLTDAQRVELRTQELARKKLLTQADGYFAQIAEGIALPDYDPLDLDTDYKEFRTKQSEATAQAAQQAESLATVIKNIENTAKKITEVNEDFEIEIDERKLPVKVNFKLNEEKQKQLVDYAKRQIPTEAEVAEFTDTDSGKFDWNGYMLSLAPSAFAKDLIKAATKQALTTDRENFIEKELKNSTLRNNDVSQVVAKEFDIVDAWPFGR